MPQQPAENFDDIRDWLSDQGYLLSRRVRLLAFCSRHIRKELVPEVQAYVNLCGSPINGPLYLHVEDSHLFPEACTIHLARYPWVLSVYKTLKAERHKDRKNKAVARKMQVMYGLLFGYSGEDIHRYLERTGLL